MEKDAPKWTWSFGTGSYIDICKDGIACIHFSFDCKLKFRIAWSAGYFSNDDWEHAIKCVKEAKAVLKKIKRI